MNESVKSVPLIAHTINFFSQILYLVAVEILVTKYRYSLDKCLWFLKRIAGKGWKFKKVLYQKLLLYPCEWPNETDNILYVAMI